MDRAQRDKTLLLRNARIVLPERVTQASSIVIEAGRIARIGESAAATESAGAIDLTGLTLFPGFIDFHIHGAVGVDVMEGSAADLHAVSEFLGRQGVTGWLPTLVPAGGDQYEHTIEAINTIIQDQRNKERTDWERGRPARPSAQSPTVSDKALRPLSRRAGRPRSQCGARVLGIHYEGPFVNSAQCGALHNEFFRTFADPADVDDLPVPRANGAVKMITVAPEIDGGIELVRELNRRGWIVSIGHTRAAVDVLGQAYEAGARHMTHFMNAMAPLHHRAPGPVGWGLSRDDVTCDIIADGIHLDRFILRMLLKLKTSERLSLISDAIAAAGMGDGDYEIWGETISVKDGRTQNARGSIAGSVITMLDAVRMMLSLGVSEVAVARMAAANPGRLLGLDHECGTVEEGKRADLVALDQDGNVRLTIVGGEVLSFAGV